MLGLQDHPGRAAAEPERIGLLIERYESSGTQRHTDFADLGGLQHF